MEIEIEKTYEANGVTGVVYTANGRRCATFIGKEWGTGITEKTVAMQVFATKRTTIPAPFGLEFGPDKEVDTRRGTRHVRNAEPTDRFWDAWNADKEAMKDAGYAVTKFRGEWQVALWTDGTVWAAPRIRVQKTETPKAPKMEIVTKPEYGMDCYMCGGPTAVKGHPCDACQDKAPRVAA